MFILENALMRRLNVAFGLALLAVIIIMLCVSASAFARATAAPEVLTTSLAGPGMSVPVTVTGMSVPVRVDQQVDLSPWLKMLIAVASTSVPVFLGLIATWAQAHFKVAKDSAASATIDLAVTAGQQFVAAALKDAPTTAYASIKNQTINKWVTTLSQGTEAAMALRGTTADTIAQRIDGALALALTPPAAAATVAPPKTS